MFQNRNLPVSKISSMAKTLTLAIFGTFFAIFKHLTGSKTLQKHFYLVAEVLSFDLVGHM